MCTRTTFFGLFYMVLLTKYVDTAFKKELQLRMSVEQSIFPALMSRCTSGLSEQPEAREAEPCPQGDLSGEPDPVGCRWSWCPCLGTGHGHPAEDTPGGWYGGSRDILSVLRHLQLRWEEGQRKPPAARPLPSSSTSVMMAQSLWLRGTL